MSVAMTTQSTARWRRRKDARPTEIVAAALACFKERGFSATRLEDVAAKAGVTKGTIYLYYSSKEDLFKAVVRGELIPNIEHLERASRDSESASAMLAQFFAIWTEHVLPSPASVIPKLVIAEAGNFPELVRFYRETVVERGLALVGSIIRRGIDQGEFRPVDVEHVVFSVLAPLLITVIFKHSLQLPGDRPLDAKAVCQAHLDLLLHGLRAQSPIDCSPLPGPQSPVSPKKDR
jgi:AcrR family transcriptional regulator